MRKLSTVAGIKDPYTKRILSNTLHKDAFQLYKQTPAALRRSLRGLKERDLRAPLGRGKWSIAQIVAHLCDAELVTSWRYRMAISQSGCRIQAYDQERWEKSLGYKVSDCRKKVELFVRMREENIAMLNALTRKEWKRFGMHEERGKETVERMVQMIAGHDINHLRQIREMGHVYRNRTA